MSKDIRDEIQENREFIKNTVEEAIARSPKIAALAEAMGRVEKGQAKNLNPYASHPGYEAYERGRKKFMDMVWRCRS